MWSFIAPQSNNNDVEDDNNNNNETAITTSLWNLLGYTETSPKEENKENIIENKADEDEKEENENLSEPQTEQADIKETTSYEQFLESERDMLKKKEKKKKKKKKKIKEKRNEEQPNNNNNNYDESPLMSDISSFANQGSDNGREDDFIRDADVLEEEENDENEKEEHTSSNKSERSTTSEVMKNSEDEGEEKDHLEEPEETHLDDNAAENWLFIGKFRSMLEPSINQESISEIISTQYMNFSQANAGLFDLLENLILSGNSKANEENKEKRANTKKPYGSYEESPNSYYNFIDYAIYSINRELSANIEMEALRMVKIYNAAYLQFKEEINYRDDVFQDIVNEAEEYSTYKYDEKKRKKKKIVKIDFLILINLNLENYNTVINCQTVHTPKINLEEILKMNVN